MLLNNQYRLIRTLGSGDYSTTYLGQIPSGLTCVIKAFKPISQKTQIHQWITKQFLKQAEDLLNKSQGKSYLPKIYDYFIKENKYYIVQEAIEGVSLTNKVQVEPKYNIKEVKEFLLTILPIIDELHQNNILHQELTPDNIIFRLRDQKPVILKTGLAPIKELMGLDFDEDGQLQRVVIGAKGYMALEHIAQNPVNASDLYSLGLTTIYYLTGILPQDLPTDPNTQQIICPFPEGLLTPGFTKVIQKAIAPAVGDRYPTAIAMLEDIKAQNITQPTNKINRSLIIMSTLGAVIFIGVGVLVAYFNRPLNPTGISPANPNSTNTSQATLIEDAPDSTIQLIPSTQVPPLPKREFRGAWVATVLNIDWPSKAGLSTQQQEAELKKLLDEAVKLNLNGIIFQVRPSADAFYQSSLEPWSEFLTGTMGKAPDPLYDPLELAIKGARERALQLHAWVNPFRARHAKAISPISADHISKKHPEWVKKYGDYLWLDPGIPEVREYVIQVMLDLVKRYDIDGIHLDDYFYPNGSGEFPDDESWQKYQASGGTLSRADWRRENINQFIEQLYKAVKAEKPEVQVGISPFGIWQSDHPPGVEGISSYDTMYADSRKWLENGWLDYFSPQLYFNDPKQDYKALLAWWVAQNKKERHIWPGLFTSRIKDGTDQAWTPDVITSQIEATRSDSGATGNIHFSMRVLLENRDQIFSILKNNTYQEPSLIPASIWISKTFTDPLQPIVSSKTNPQTQEIRLTWKPQGTEEPNQWVVQTLSDGTWTTAILPGWHRSYPLNAKTPNLPTAIALSQVNRSGVQGKPTVVEIKSKN